MSKAAIVLDMTIAITFLIRASKGLFLSFLHFYTYDVILTSTILTASSVVTMMNGIRPTELGSSCKHENIHYFILFYSNKNKARFW